MENMGTYDNGFGFAGGTYWLWIFVLFILLGGFGGNGFGGFGRGGAGAEALNLEAIQMGTKAAIAESNNMQTLNDQIRNIASSITTTGYDLGNAMQGIASGITSNMNQGFNGVMSSINNAHFGTERALDRLSYEGAQNTCAITRAIAEDGEKTRAVLTQNTIQDLRDKLADRDRELQTAQFAYSQQSQSNDLLSKIGLMYKGGCGCAYSA